jgi:hypothetical protein
MSGGRGGRACLAATSRATVSGREAVVTGRGTRMASQTARPADRMARQAAQRWFIGPAGWPPAEAPPHGCHSRCGVIGMARRRIAGRRCARRLGRDRAGRGVGGSTTRGRGVQGHGMGGGGRSVAVEALDPVHAEDGGQQEEHPPTTVAHATSRARRTPRGYLLDRRTGRWAVAGADGRPTRRARPGRWVAGAASSPSQLLHVPPLHDASAPCRARAVPRVAPVGERADRPAEDRGIRDEGGVVGVVVLSWDVPAVRQLALEEPQQFAGGQPAVLRRLAGMVRGAAWRTRGRPVDGLLRGYAQSLAGESAGRRVTCCPWTFSGGRPGDRRGCRRSLRRWRAVLSARRPGNWPLRGTSAAGRATSPGRRCRCRGGQAG